MEENDVQLIHKILSGDDEAFSALVRKHQKSVHALAWRKFTPSQFTGHLIINRVEEKVAFFRMYVPEGTLNFDVNRYHGDGPSFGADTGFCPQIELHTGAEDIVQDTQFSESITLAEAERALILHFYKSQQINWVSVDEALEIARTQQKQIHVVSTDGPLDDEVC